MELVLEWKGCLTAERISAYHSPLPSWEFDWHRCKGDVPPPTSLPQVLGTKGFIAVGLSAAKITMSVNSDWPLHPAGKVMQPVRHLESVPPNVWAEFVREEGVTCMVKVAKGHFDRNV